MDKQKYINDLKEIKTIMDRSSKFISLSGLSGVIAGIAALLGAYAAYNTVYKGQDYLSYRHATINQGSILTLCAISLITIIVSFAAGLYFTKRKAKKHNQSLWDSQAKRLIINLMIPLAVGGVLCFILLFKGIIGLVAPITLIFYGLALVNASKYTLSEIRSLGIVEIILGLIGCQYVGFGLILWAIGFGAMHIIYGIYMHVKYDS
jgi:hypothetical protein